MLRGKYVGVRFRNLPVVLRRILRVCLAKGHKKKAPAVRQQRVLKDPWVLFVYMFTL